MVPRLEVAADGAEGDAAPRSDVIVGFAAWVATLFLARSHIERLQRTNSLIGQGHNTYLRPRLVFPPFASLDVAN
jgi:hypothetical protein